MNDFDANLIREFRSRPAFYDRNNERFKDKVFTAREWQEISNKLGYDVSLLKDRMLQLRNRYNLEKRRIEQVREENPGIAVDSPWPLFDHLQFLSEHIRARRSYKRMLNTQPQHHNVRLEASGGSNTSSGGEGDETVDKSSEMMQMAMHHPFLPVRVKLESHDEDNEASGGGSTNEGSLLQQMQQAYQEQQQQHEQQQQRKQQQQQQQQQMQQNDTDADDSESQSVTDNGAFLTAQSAAMLQNKQAFAQQQQQSQQRQQYQPQPRHINPIAVAQPALKVRRLDAMRNAAAVNSIPATQNHHNNQHKRHHQNHSNSNSFASVNVAASAAPPPMPMTTLHANTIRRSTATNAYATAREQKYAAFGDFVASSLMEIPSVTAMQLIEKFTSEVVKVLIQNEDAKNPLQHASNSTATTAATNAVNCNGNMSAAVN